MALKLSDNKRNSLLALVLIGALIVDTLLSNISDILSSQLDTTGGVVLFVILAALIFGSAYYLLIYLKNISSEPRSRKPVLNTIYKLMVRSMFVLTAIVAVISLQMIISSEYSIPLTVAATLFSYILAGAVMALLGYYLFRWFILNKKSIMVALFAVAAFMTAAASACLGISQGGLFLATGPLVIHRHASINYPNINPELTGAFGNLLSVAYIETMLSYALTWAAASILLYHYSKRIGMKKYLTLVIVPMGAFIIGITPILFSLPTTGTYFDPKLLVFRLVSISSLIAVGILFGLAFRVVVKSIHPHVKGPLIDYLRISSYGLAFLFVVLAANIARDAYPPFGITSYSFTAIASYFFMMGIYSSAVVISTDSEVRRKISKSTIEQSKLLDNIGSAHMEQELERMVLPMAKKYSEDLAEESGFESSITYFDPKEYVKEVIDEIKAQKKTP
jgi:large-conductance mechanosensitive channel